MSIFSAIGHWLGKLFGAKASIVEKILTDIHKIVDKALPYVAELSVAIGVVDGVEHNVILEKVSGWLKKHITDVAVIEKFLAANAGAPLPSLLHNAVVLVASHAGEFTAALLTNLDSAVQLAYSVYVAENASMTSGQTGAAALLKK